MNYEKQKKLEKPNLVLTVLEETFNIHRLASDPSLPEAISECDFYSLSKLLMNCRWFVQDLLQ